MTAGPLTLISAADLPPARRQALDDETIRTAGQIVRDVQTGGEAALRQHAEHVHLWNV